MINISLCFCVVGLLLSGCVTVQKVNCPPNDVMILVPTPMGSLTIELEKGLLNKENEDNYYIDSEKYDKLMREQEQETQEGI